MLPSSTNATPSCLPTSAIGRFFPLKKNDEVRAATFNFGIFANTLSNSSVIPSPRYSSFLSAPRFTNGSTAIDLSVAGGLRSRKNAATATMATTATTEIQAGVRRRGATDGPPAVFETEAAGVTAPPPGDGVSRRLMRSTNCGVDAPSAKRVHCTALNSTGTSASASRVASITTGIRNAVRSEIMCARCAASRHSSRK